jgi:hypothetical protein
MPEIAAFELFSEDAAQQRDALVCCIALTDNKRLQ